MIQARRKQMISRDSQTTHCVHKAGLLTASISAGRALQKSAEDDGGVFAESAITETEGRGDVRVDIELADDFAVNADRDHDFGFGFKRAGEIARIGIDVVDDDGFSRGGGRAANALVQRDAGMGRRGSLEGAKN
jgi:hypothetical protein